MKLAKSGRIMLVSLELAYLGRENFLAYCVSKAGVVQLTRALAREPAPHITVNSVAPGPVYTPMLSLKNTSKEWIQKELDDSIQKLRQPHEIAALISFLCSSSKSFLQDKQLSQMEGL